MYEIIEKQILNPSVTQMKIHAPHVAKKALPGQFIILRVNETGERIPLTIADFDRVAGSITIIFQILGKTTLLLNTLNVGDHILDFVGPLGTPSHLDGYQNVAVVGGGLGTAIAYPQAKALHQMGANVDVIAGFRDKDLVILENDLEQNSTRCFIMTDDGSIGEKGFVTTKLEQLIQSGQTYDLVIAIGPLPMMRAVADLTRIYGIKTIVSMNPIMIDGTGMCGGCRLTVGGQTKFACIDGPDFDGHQVDFEEAIRRSAMYKNPEQQSRDMHCRLMQKEVG